jgi:tetratricopeptide (TPR) repeat protein
MEQLNKKRIFKDADFWYHKGISSAKKGNFETAIECYKQALKLVRYGTPVYYNFRTKSTFHRYLISPAPMRKLISIHRL